MSIKFSSSIYTLIFLFCLFFTSCVSKNKILYFQDIESLNHQLDNINYNTRISPGDLLSITVSSQDPESVAIFNPLVGSLNELTTKNERLGTYLVDSNGNIEFPFVGTLKIANMSRGEAISLLKKEINKYAKETVVDIRILNFSISVLGEVQRPGTFTIPNERITALEALGLAGDMTIFGERKTVKIIRDKNGVKSYGELDFTSIDLMSSPFYYLQQNDVIIVSPNKAKVQSGAFNRNSTIFISIAGIIISVLTIITR